MTTDRLLCRVVEQPLRGRVPGRDDPAGVHQHDRDGVRLDEGLVVPPLTLDLADVVVDDAVPDPLAPDQDGRGEELDVDEGTVLVGPARDHANPSASRGFGVEPGGLLPLLGRPRDEIVDAHPDRLVRAVAEEAFRFGVPRRDVHLDIQRDDRGRADVQDGLEPALLLLNLGDVVIDDVAADLLPTRDHRDDQEFDIEDGPVASGPLRDRTDQLAARRGLGVRLRVLMELRPGGQQVVRGPSDGLLGREAEESFGRRVPRDDPRVEVGDHDGRRARLQQRLEIALLVLELRHVVVEGVLGDDLTTDGDRTSDDVDVDERSVLPGALRQQCGRLPPSSACWSSSSPSDRDGPRAWPRGR